MSIIVAPSMLSANFGNLDKDVEMVNQSEAGWFHLDIMDGVFVPNISYGFPVVKAMAKNVSERYPSATRMLADMDEFRKDPTVLFDYTGLPIDASIRVQKPVTVPAEDVTA